MRIFENPVYLAIIALFGAMIFVGGVNARWFGSAKLVLLRRWIRAACFSLAVFVCLRHFLDDRPVWVLGASSVLLFLLLESAFYWAGISLENTDEGHRNVPEVRAYRKRVEHPRTPRKTARVHSCGGLLRERQIQAAVDDELGVSVFATTFDSADGLSRMCVMFPFGGGVVCDGFGEIAACRRRVMLTESRFIPNGLDYPGKLRRAEFSAGFEPAFGLRKAFEEACGVRFERGRRFGRPACRPQRHDRRGACGEHQERSDKPSVGLGRRRRLHGRGKIPHLDFDDENVVHSVRLVGGILRGVVAFALGEADFLDGGLEVFLAAENVYFKLCVVERDCRFQVGANAHGVLFGADGKLRARVFAASKNASSSASSNLWWSRKRFCRRFPLRAPQGIFRSLRVLRLPKNTRLSRL